MLATNLTVQWRRRIGEWTCFTYFCDLSVIKWNHFSAHRLKIL